MRLETLSRHQTRILLIAWTGFLLLIAIGLWLRSSVESWSISVSKTQDDPHAEVTAVARVISPSVTGSNHNTYIFDANYRDGKLAPSAYTVAAGDTVHLTLDSKSKAKLGISALGLSREVIPWTKTFLEFNTANAGEFAIECESCEPRKTIGKIVVK